MIYNQMWKFFNILENPKPLPHLTFPKILKHFPTLNAIVIILGENKI